MIWLIIVAVVFVGGGAWFVAKSMTTRAIVLVVGLAALATYWFVGRPDMHDDPLEARLIAIEEKIKNNPDPEALDPNEMIALAQERAHKDPKDFESYRIMGMMYEALAARYQQQGAELAAAGNTKEANTYLMRFQDSLTKAMEAYRSSLRRNPSNPAALASYADLRFKSTGEVDAETAELYQAAFAAQPDNLRLGYFAGIGIWLQGRKEEAEAMLAGISARAPENGPERQMFVALRQMFGLDAPAAPETPPARPPG